MSLRFTVTLCEFGATPSERNPVEVRAVTIKRAWRVAHRWARKGARRFGGQLSQANWGVRGGQFPQRYRSAVITLAR